MSWMTKDDEIQILKNENKELKAIMENLKAELKAERLQNDKTLEFIDKHDHIDISWFPLNFDLEEIVKNRRIVL